jgi:hypothetical protein
VRREVALAQAILAKAENGNRGKPMPLHTSFRPVRCRLHNPMILRGWAKMCVMEWGKPDSQLLDGTWQKLRSHTSIILEGEGLRIGPSHHSV